MRLEKMMKSIGRLSAGAALAALALLAAACGSSSSGGGTNANSGSGSSTLTSAKTVAASSLQTKSTPIGTVLVDSNGHTIYMLVGDSTSHHICPSSCEAFWPPVMQGGSQIVINGHPAYTFVNDSGSGQTHGQGAKDTWGTWWALNASGSPVTSTSAPSPTSSSTSSSSGGGYGY
jgi:predicted lipoprotein with Yx(FWY)xxD motif